MNRWIEVQKDKWIKEKDRREGQMDRRIDGQMYRSIDGQKDKWTKEKDRRVGQKIKIEGQMDRSI